MSASKQQENCGIVVVSRMRMRTSREINKGKEVSKVGGGGKGGGRGIANLGIGLVVVVVDLNRLKDIEERIVLPGCLV